MLSHPCLLTSSLLLPHYFCCYVFWKVTDCHSVEEHEKCSRSLCQSHPTKQKIFLYKVFQCSCQQHYLLWHLKQENVTSWRKTISRLASNPTCQYLTIRGMRPNNQLSLSAELHCGAINEAEPSLMLSLPPGCLSQCLLWIKSNQERLDDFHVLNVVTRRRTFVFSC